VPPFATEVRLKLDSVWPACTGALAVLYANTGGGAWTRRSAIAWMMGSWGARLTVQALYAFRPEGLRHEETGRPEGLRLLTSSFRLLTSVAFFSLPALIASRNPDPSLSQIEIAACALWVIAFAGETTADRQLLRFTSKPENAGLTCRSGLWRYSPHAHAIFETLIWTAFALYASASPWGWLSFACPLARVVLISRGRGSDFSAPGADPGAHQTATAR
jgi:steroid 5-alpha reductase family enzyme